ncbi:hypothetical protein C2G38_2029343 [Gigaspora rosea]|uniref:Uncharacterized protein n=1 Tax=Gigaspora rosea TaxID=44941 RepID=A0A397W092_9GLOM|nr:hypothetical protein C2G38_2029343 [Gigaspora rosea]
MAKFHIGLVARRWYYDEWQDIKLEDFQSVEISMAFQRTATSIIVLDFHIIEQVRDSNIHIVKNRQLANKKVKYANRFRKMKKALNIALDLECEKELINLITHFIDQKNLQLKMSTMKIIKLINLNRCLWLTL